ncbi:ATP-binding protein [Alteromonas sp. A079]|uniref:ATP-binding protein n=1 Tax=Alteromonas sp. A079 TaxID=3410268 RepID=UPI003BA0C9DC
MLFFVKSQSVLALPLVGLTEFNSTKSGIIRDIEVLDTSVFLASENGVFQITGSQAKRIEFNSSENTLGVISDIDYDPAGYLYVVEYGAGVFKVNLRTGDSEVLFSQEDWVKQVWSIELSPNYLALSTVDNVFFYDKKTGELIDGGSYYEQSSLRSLYSITATDEDSFYVASNDRLLAISPLTRTFSQKRLSVHFPNISSLDAVKYGAGHLFLGGPEGLYKVDINSNQTTFYRFEKNTEYPIEVEKIYISKNEDVWVAAGELYYLKEGILRTTDFLNPLLSTESFRSVMDMGESEQGELLIASSQLGFVVISEGHKAVNFIHIDDNIFTKNIRFAGSTEQGDVFITTDELRLSLNTENGRLTSSKMFDNPKSESCSDWRVERLNEIYNAFTKAICGNDSTHVISESEARYYVYVDEPTGANYYLLDNNEIKDVLTAPSNIVFSTLLSTGEIAAFDSNDNVFIQLSRYRWKKLESDEFEWYGLTCLVEFLDSYYLCSSGTGLIEIKKDTYAIERSKILASEDLRFVRGATVSERKKLWIATNLGLYVHDPKLGKSYLLDKSIGIFDTDFEYDSFLHVENKMIILGDRYSYIVNPSAVEKALSSLNSKESKVAITELSWLTGEKSHFHKNTSYAPISLSFEYPIKNLTVSISSTSLLNNNEHLLQYRLLGHDDAWKTHPESHATLLFSDLGFGQYELQARVASEDNSQPISSVLLYISPPFYLTNIAWLAYFLLVIMIMVAFKRGYFQSLALRMHKHPFYAWITRYELTDGQSKFEKMLRSRERHIRDLVHEMRTPVQIMLGTLESSKSDKASISQAWGSLDQNAKRIKQLVAQMNATGPSIDDKSALYKNYSMNDLKQIVISLEPLAHQKRQTIDVKMRGNQTLSLITDSVEKIISNLIENAVKYSPEHSVIVVSASCDEKRLKISVSDHGEGIAPEYHESIFERFERAHSGEEEGTGIGLSLVKSLVTLNQGSVSVESAPGKGAKFVVTLPVDDIAYINEIETGEEALQKWAERKTLLIVEDNREFRSYLFALLANKYRCLVASTGKQALALLRTYDINLVISDLMMSPMDGLSLTDEVRKLNENMPVVILTACSDEKEKRKAFAKKVDCFLTKPVSNEELLVRISHQLSLRDSLPEASIENEISHTPKSLIIPELALEKDMSFYLNFISVLENHYKDESFNRDKAAKAMLMSSRNLNRKLSELFEYNFSEFLTRFRVDKATPQLLSGATVTDACLDVGFGTASYFSTTFKRIKGVSPKKFVEQHQRNAVA